MITDKQRKLIFSMFRDYSKEVYGEVGKYYTSLSENILKKLYVRSTGKYNTSYEPFKTLHDSVKLVVSTERDPDTATKEIMEYIIGEIKMLHLQLNQSFSLKREYFTKVEAKEFIEWLMGYFFENNIELNINTVKMLQENDQNKFAYLCLVNKRCCICGRKVTFPHHHKSVSMVGGYKKDKGTLPIVALCPYHHSELHSSINKFDWIAKHETYAPLICNDDVIELLKTKYTNLFQDWERDTGGKD